ncbi:DNA methyltransferase [Micromonospora sp. WMMD987]|uniref:TRM11 family SAM-dependent methyltransferase n=1 Tax=Micromonospora sp. WMMD987 TaxID=3016089 RepID=UPI00249A829E|nr:DNA methyltransferase [Micromonospora sp. WMMD987]WFE93567.1 DNA methyltransferase [Micromonospora sp. WMMD987]
MPEPHWSAQTPGLHDSAPHPDGSDLPALLAEGYLGSVWLTGQHPSRDLRRGRYTPESLAHPGKMLPTIARYAIRTYTNPGDVVLDPMAGIGTTIIEAMHLGRHGVGAEYEPEWVASAAANIHHAGQTGASGRGEIYQGDSTALPALLPASLHGRASLVITSPPYGSSTHGHVRTPGPRRGKVRKINHKYGSSDNLAYCSHGQLADGFTAILAGCRTLLRPGGHVIVTARPYRRHGELIDIPGMVTAAGINAGLELVEECIALVCGVRNGSIIPRASFFQQKNTRDAITTGDPQWLLQHEDVVVLRAPLLPHAGSRVQPGSPVGGLKGPGDDDHPHRSPSPLRPTSAGSNDGLDTFGQERMDRRPHLAHPAVVPYHGSAVDPRSQPGWDPEWKSGPCTTIPQPAPVPVPSDAAGYRRRVSRATSGQQPDPANTMGRQ